MSDTDTEVLEKIAEEPPDNADLPAALAAAAPRRWRNRATPVLLGLVLLAGGFLGGVATQKRWGEPATARPAVVSTGQRPGTLPSAGPGFPGGAGADQRTTGTLKAVTAGTLTMRTAGGRTVTVRIGGTTKVQRETTLDQLEAGRPVTVQGSTATDGTIIATAVTAS